MTLLTPALALLAAISSPSQDFVKQAQAACAAPSDARPAIDGITVEPVAATGTDLPSLRVTDGVSGGWMRVYYDAPSERSSRSRAACLGAQIRLLDAELGNGWPKAQWFSVVFTSRADYVPPRSATESRWTIPTEADGSLGAAGQWRVVIVMPHEQVHAFQKRAGAETPRWFHEGHAEWIGRKVSTAIAPELARQSGGDYADALRNSSEPVALGRWGGVSIKREALLRQVGPEDRAKMEADPHYMPPGPFSFGPGDMVSDESNAKARYEAARLIFIDLERRYGADAVLRWSAQLTAVSGRVKPETVLESARTVLGEDLTARLD